MTNTDQPTSSQPFLMERWKPPGSTCISCPPLNDETTTTLPCTMVANNSPLKTTLNGGGLIKNGNHHNNHINNHHKMGIDANGHMDLVADHYSCLKPGATKPNGFGAEPLQEEDSCGLWSLKPKWLQPFANKKAFLAVFCLTSVLQGMYYTYFVSVLTTIEKLYQIQSKTTGIIMSATEIGQIGGALLLTYYGGQGHRPKWIACGMMVFAIASILCSTPHFLFGEVTLPTRTFAEPEENVTTATLRELRSKLCQTNLPFPVGSSVSTWTPSSISSSSSSPSSPTSSHSSVSSASIASSVDNNTTSNIPEENTSLNEFLYVPWENNSTYLSQLPPRQDAYRGRQRSKCESRNKSGLQTRTTHTVLSIFFVSLLFIGIGATAVYTLGIPYIDDNVATRESPLYFGITIGVRIFGPVFGFLLGSFCTSVYVNFPFESSGITPDDPQWIGAWWLGVFIVGAALILTSFPMMAFPRKLPQTFHHHHHHHHEAEVVQANGNSNGSHQCHHQYYNCHSMKSVKKPSLKDFPSAMRRLLKNEILLCRTASSVLHILPIAGLYTFLPKYLESQFQLTATKANMISGMAGILVMGVGIFASGTFMRKFKPNARFVARWIALAALAYAIGMMILMWLGCPLNNYVGLNAGSGAQMANQKTCNATCGCRPGEFAPVCTSEGVTYLSPCLAGCTVVTGSAQEQYVYRDCHCLGANVTAVNGFCPLQCDNLLWYILIFSIFVLIHSTSEVGSMLLTLRCVDPQDKAMALGLISFAIGLFGNVPCPIIYGAVVDSACLFWEDNCGEPGACRLYDPSKFRMVFHGVTAVIMLAAFLVDAVVWYKAKSIQFQDEEGLAEGEETIPINPPPDNTQFESSV